VQEEKINNNKYIYSLSVKTILSVKVLLKYSYTFTDKVIYIVNI